MNTTCLLVAKAPVPGEAKTRLGAAVGMEAAAELAAASLLDSISAASAAFGPQACVLALSGDLGLARRGPELVRDLAGWTVFAQEGEGFGARLAHAHLETARRRGGHVVQIGMDTPQVSAVMLLEAAAGLRATDAVLGMAVDGGWWILGLSDARHAHVLRTVPTSVPTTGQETLVALRDAGLQVRPAPVLRDVDTVHDADTVAQQAPSTRFAEAWSGVRAAWPSR